MSRFDETKIENEEFYGAEKPIKIWDFNADNKVITNLIGMKNNSKYLIGYLHQGIKPLVLILPKMSGYVKFFK